MVSSYKPFFFNASMILLRKLIFLNPLKHSNSLFTFYGFHLEFLEKFYTVFSLFCTFYPVFLLISILFSQICRTIPCILLGFGEAKFFLRFSIAFLANRLKLHAVIFIPVVIATFIIPFTFTSSNP